MLLAADFVRNIELRETIRVRYFITFYNTPLVGSEDSLSVQVNIGQVEQLNRLNYVFFLKKSISKYIIVPSFCLAVFVIVIQRPEDV